MTERSGFAGGMKDKPGMLVGPKKDHILDGRIFPKPMSSPASRILDGRLYVIGGWDGRTQEGTTFGDKKWLSSPEVWVADAPVF